MFSKKEREVKAILAQKEISNTKWSNGATNVVRMKYALSTETRTKKESYILVFKTISKTHTFRVESNLYNKYKINSLCVIKYKGKQLLNIEFLKIATKSDLDSLS